MSILSLLGKLPDQPLVSLAPMAGVSDLPFRRVVHCFGADYSVTEMASAMPHLRDSSRNQQRLGFPDDDKVKIIQILGNHADDMALAAKYYADLGADIIDINMGCPAKKVCKKAAGSALLEDLNLVSKILEKVVEASPVPVSLKTRLGTNIHHITIDEVAKRAENTGIELLTIHGRTRACKFQGSAWFNDIARVKKNTSIPIIVNGDIDSAAAAKNALAQTEADGVMIGRAAIGNPQIFTEIKEYIANHKHNKKCSFKMPDYVKIICSHVEHMHDFYGERKGVHIARKHIRKYVKHANLSLADYPDLLTETNSKRQLALLADVFTYYL